MLFAGCYHILESKNEALALKAKKWFYEGKWSIQYFRNMPGKWNTQVEINFLDII